MFGCAHICCQCQTICHKATLTHQGPRLRSLFSESTIFHEVPPSPSNRRVLCFSPSVSNADLKNVAARCVCFCGRAARQTREHVMQILLSNTHPNFLMYMERGQIIRSILLCSSLFWSILFPCLVLYCLVWHYVMPPAPRHARKHTAHTPSLSLSICPGADQQLIIHTKSVDSVCSGPELPGTGRDRSSVQRIN